MGLGLLVEFIYWVYLVGFLFGQNGFMDDFDGDGVVNLLEFIYGLNLLLFDVDGVVVIVVVVGGEDYLVLKFCCNQIFGGVVLEVCVSMSIEFFSDFGIVEVLVML